MAEAIAAISVFCEDKASFAQALKLWRRRVPAYFYLTIDGKVRIQSMFCATVQMFGLSRTKSNHSSSSVVCIDIPSTYFDESQMLLSPLSDTARSP